MTENRQRKQAVREHMERYGERYVVAWNHIQMKERGVDPHEGEGERYVGEE